jgi:hypothetical protein
MRSCGARARRTARGCGVSGCAPPPTTPCGSKAGSACPPLTGQRLKEDEDRAKDHSKATSYGADGVRSRLRVRNQIEQREAHDQEDDEPLDPPHVGLSSCRSSQTIRTRRRSYRQKTRCSPFSTRAKESPRGNLHSVLRDTRRIKSPFAETPRRRTMPLSRIGGHTPTPK